MTNLKDNAPTKIFGGLINAELSDTFTTIVKLKYGMSMKDAIPAALRLFLWADDEMQDIARISQACSAEELGIDFPCVPMGKRVTVTRSRKMLDAATRILEEEKQLADNYEKGQKKARSNKNRK